MGKRKIVQIYFKCLLLLLPAFPLEAGLQRNPYLFFYESCKNSQLVSLKARTDFEKSVSRESSEYGKMILLKAWVYKKLTYSFKSSFPSERNSHSILEKSENGTAFLCSSFAALYMQSAQSLGWSVRYYFLRSPNGLQHAAVEVWSNQFRKWIYIDPTWNVHTEFRGKPCSLLEIREHWLLNGGKNLDYIFDAGKNSNIYRYSHFPVRRNDSLLWERFPLGKGWLSYTYEIAMVGRNNFFHMATDPGKISGVLYIFTWIPVTGMTGSGHFVKEKPCQKGNSIFN